MIAQHSRRHLMYYLFKDQYRSFRDLLLEAPEVDVGSWHSMDVSGRSDLVTHELPVYFHTHIPRTVEGAQRAFEPNLPWAEDQFLERVSGEPLNPGNTYKDWPWQSKMDEHVDQVFTHTYMERYWPKRAGEWQFRDDDGVLHDGIHPPHQGIRFPYGDLYDLVSLLARSPFTRQAVLPVWFPEDTGGVHGGRLPCSLTYQFLLRDGKLNCYYSIRSCDFVRHFRDDCYLTARLTQWVLGQLRDRGIQPKESVWNKGDVRPGTLSFHCPSLHIMKGDRPKLEKEKAQDERNRVTAAGLSPDSPR